MNSSFFFFLFIHLYFHFYFFYFFNGSSQMGSDEMTTDRTTLTLAAMLTHTPATARSARGLASKLTIGYSRLRRRFFVVGSTFCGLGQCE